MSTKKPILESMLNASTKQLAMVTLAFAGIVAPGIALMYMFFPDWLIRFDVSKLILFATVPTIPIFLLNWFTINYGNYVYKCDFGEAKILSMALFITALAFYASIPVMLLSGGSIRAVICCLIFSNGFALGLYLHDARTKYSKEKVTVIIPGIPRE